MLASLMPRKSRPKAKDEREGGAVFTQFTIGICHFFVLGAMGGRSLQRLRHRDQVYLIEKMRKIFSMERGIENVIR